MAKNWVFIIILSIQSANSQECGFKFDKDIEDWFQKMEWFIPELSNQKLKFSKDKNDIPKHIKKQLDCHHSLDRTNDQLEYSSNCVTESTDLNHIGFIAKNKHILMIRFFTHASCRSGHNIWIKYDNSGISDFWHSITVNGNSSKEKFNLKKYLDDIRDENSRMYNTITGLEGLKQKN